MLRVGPFSSLVVYERDGSVHRGLPGQSSVDIVVCFALVHLLNKSFCILLLLCCLRSIAKVVGNSLAVTARCVRGLCQIKLAPWIYQRSSV